MESITYAPNRPIIGIATGREMSGLTDQAVVERVLGGEMDAFSILVDRYQDRIYSAVLNYVANREDAVDITQDTFVKAYSKLTTFNSGSAFYTWLYRIAVNAAIDFIRKRKSRPADSLDDDKYTEVGFEPVSHDMSTDPERVIVRSEQVHMLRNAISKLSDKLKMALVLYDIEGLSQEEVAQILNVPVGTVKSRVSRARTELRYLLGKQLGETL
ncbi:sigma-70 family RNA polymerase sigma factor [bacterium]|nr:sigma-70 family RNA polymerase sigma factor [bacterium]